MDLFCKHEWGMVVEQLSLSEFDLDEKPHVVLNEVISIVKGAVKDEK